MAKQSKVLTLRSQERRENREGTLFVLQDPEGNGPGFLEIVKGEGT